MNEIILPALKISTEDFEAAEDDLIRLFKKELYYPLLAELGTPRTVLQNNLKQLIDAIISGRIVFYRGHFTGRFSSQISKELRDLGAEWSRRQGSWKISGSSLPWEIRDAVRVSEAKFLQKTKNVDKRLSQILPERIAEKVQLGKFFDRAIFKTQKSFEDSVRTIVVPPQLSESARKKLAADWNDNMKLWIKDWSEKEIKTLRKNVQEAVFRGERRESLVKKIEDSYEVSRSKAKFLARQETSLLMAKFKRERYVDVGSKSYIWGCVAGSPAHPVRPAHKKLENKKFSWDDPPNTAPVGKSPTYNHPGEDYNCRCFARAVIRF